MVCFKEERQFGGINGLIAWKMWSSSSLCDAGGICPSPATTRLITEENSAKLLVGGCELATRLNSLWP